MKNIKKIITLLILLAVAAYVVAFTLGNKHTVLLDPVIWPAVENSLAIWMLLSFCSGVVVAGLFASVFLLKGSHQKRKAQKELKKTNKELEKVRSDLPSESV